MSTLTIGIIFVIIAIWAAIIISMVCNCIERCMIVKYLGKYMDKKEANENFDEAQKVLENFEKNKEGGTDGR